MVIKWYLNDIKLLSNGINYCKMIINDIKWYKIIKKTW